MLSQPSEMGFFFQGKGKERRWLISSASWSVPQSIIKCSTVSSKHWHMAHRRGYRNRWWGIRVHIENGCEHILYVCDCMIAEFLNGYAFGVSVICTTRSNMLWPMVPPVNLRTATGCTSTAKWENRTYTVQLSTDSGPQIECRHVLPRVEGKPLNVCGKHPREKRECHERQ